MTKLANQHISLARKYRPMNFAGLRGQEILVKILSYTINNNRLAQGYLLTGIRGVGKTTSARIIAKTANCANIIVDHDNVAACEQCESCASFNKNSHPNIIEIDAASKTGVDDVRRIIEISEYRPLLGKYKVFIIDEVHMLSKGAFNALLKILEEPPPHVIFIFATTEVQKIPLTVVSRCQRYDLRRLTVSEIVDLLKSIAEKESLKCELDALKMIASKSDGSARDAISMLDQASHLVRQDSETVNCQIINQMLGLVDTTSVIEFCHNIVTKNADAAILLINKLYLSSANLEIFVELVADFIAHLNKVKMLPHYAHPVYESFHNEIENILAQVSFPSLSILWQIYSKAIAEIKISHNQLIEVEMLVIKSIYSTSLPSMEELAQTDQMATTATKAQLDYQKIGNFLQYLHQHNEMAVYYLLLNQVEIISFTDDTLKIVGNNLDKTLKTQLMELLFAWMGKNFSIIIEKQTKIVTLKEQLTNQVVSEKDWGLLKKHFPDVGISDILLQNQ